MGKKGKRAKRSAKGAVRKGLVKTRLKVSKRKAVKSAVKPKQRSARKVAPRKKPDLNPDHEIAWIPRAEDDSSQQSRIGFGSRIKSLFTRTKKESAADGTDTLPVLEDTAELPEPAVLKEIDLGVHNSSVAPELALWLSDGRVVRSLQALKDALATMKEGIYSQHTTGRNELSDWVKDVIGNDALAHRLSIAKNKHDAEQAVDAFLKTGTVLPPEMPQPTAQEHKQRKDIEKAITAAGSLKLPRAHVSKRKIESNSLTEKEDRLDRMEKALDRDEEELNQKRLELSRRRYALVKSRGELEKQKFEEFMTKHKRLEQPSSKSNKHLAMPDLVYTEPYTTNKIGEDISAIKDLLARGSIPDAEDKLRELKATIATSYVPADERKQMEYRILELEADVKLAALA
jgi:hypothetical protein